MRRAGNILVRNLGGGAIDELEAREDWPHDMVTGKCGLMPL